MLVGCEPRTGWFLELEKVSNHHIHVSGLAVSHNLRWEFIKENKRVRKQENTNSTKKAIKKTRKKERKHALDQESDKEKRKKFLITFLFEFLFSCF